MVEVGRDLYNQIETASSQERVAEGCHGNRCACGLERYKKYAVLVPDRDGGIDQELSTPEAFCLGEEGREVFFFDAWHDRHISLPSVLFRERIVLAVLKEAPVDRRLHGNPMMFPG